MLVSLKRQLVGPLISAVGKRKEKRIFQSPPILIGGAQRSGTTLLLAMLSAHPHIWALPDETSAFQSWTKDKNGKSQQPVKLYRIYKKILSSRIPSNAKRWCEKTPLHVRYIRQIMDFFEEDVRFIHITRDGRDVMTSIHHDEPDRFFVPPKRWVNDVRAGLAFKDHPNILTIKYEDLIRENATVLKRICEFLDEPFEDEIRNWYDYTPKRKDKAWSSKLQDLYTSSIGRWKNPKFEERIKEVLDNEEVRSLLEELGYAD